MSFHPPSRSTLSTASSRGTRCRVMVDGRRGRIEHGKKVPKGGQSGEAIQRSLLLFFFSLYRFRSLCRQDPQERRAARVYQGEKDIRGTSSEGEKRLTRTRFPSSSPPHSGLFLKRRYDGVTARVARGPLAESRRRQGPPLSRPTCLAIGPPRLTRPFFLPSPHTRCLSTPGQFSASYVSQGATGGKLAARDVVALAREKARDSKLLVHLVSQVHSL